MINTGSDLDLKTCTVADIALNYPQAIRILNQYGLDYGCNGKKSFLTACEKAYVNAEKVWEEILKELAHSGNNNRRTFKNWETNLLIDFILQHHHEYLRVTIPQIRELLQTVCSVHYDKYELLEIKQHFEVLSDELLKHLPREEDVLFPAFRRLADPLVGEACPPLLQNVISTIAIMEHEHGRAGELIRMIRELSHDYAIPAHACPTFHLLFKLLEEFEYDVMQHIHLENNILFPKIKQA